MDDFSLKRKMVQLIKELIQVKEQNRILSERLKDAAASATSNDQPSLNEIDGIITIERQRSLDCLGMLKMYQNKVLELLSLKEELSNKNVEDQLTIRGLRISVRQLEDLTQSQRETLDMIERQRDLDERERYYSSSVVQAQVDQLSDKIHAQNEQLQQQQMVLQQANEKQSKLNSSYEVVVRQLAAMQQTLDSKDIQCADLTAQLVSLEAMASTAVSQLASLRDSTSHGASSSSPELKASSSLIAFNNPDETDGRSGVVDSGDREYDINHQDFERVRWSSSSSSGAMAADNRSKTKPSLTLPSTLRLSSYAISNIERVAVPSRKVVRISTPPDDINSLKEESEVRLRGEYDDLAAVVGVAPSTAARGTYTFSKGAAAVSAESMTTTERKKKKKKSVSPTVSSAASIIPPLIKKLDANGSQATFDNGGQVGWNCGKIGIKHKKERAMARLELDISEEGSYDEALFDLLSDELNLHNADSLERDELFP